MPRTIAIGDIHGCSQALASILSAIDPQPDDTIITLGDYVDRGSDSKGVLDKMIDLSKRCRLIPILGNHDELMLRAKDDHLALRTWTEFAGTKTLDSYGDTGQLDLVPDEHFEFLHSCVPYFETDRHLFVHANYDPHLPLALQDEDTLRWLTLTVRVPKPHFSGKIAILGHTPQDEVLRLDHLICIDTGCGFGRTLTALDVETGKIWQVPE